MTDSRELPQQLQELFDDRREPLDAPDVQAWLLARPERLEAFARLRSVMQPAPAALPRSLPQHRLRWWLPLVAAMVGVTLACLRPWAAAAARAAPLPRPNFATSGRVVAFSCGTAAAGRPADEGGCSVWSASSTAGTAARHSAASLVWRPEPSPSVPFFVTVVRAEENQPAGPRP